MIHKLLLVAGGLAWGATSFLGGLYLTFPAQVARDRVEYEFGLATGQDYAISIGDLSLWRLSGIDLDDVGIHSVKKGRKTKDTPKPAMERTLLASFDRLAVRAAPIPTLMGKRAVDFIAEIYGGDIDGRWIQSADGVQISFAAEDIDLTQLPAQGGDISLRLLGKLEGEADLELKSEDVKTSTGTLRLSFPGLGLGAGSKVGGFGLPEVVFEKAVVALEVQDGKLEVTEGTFESPILNATLSGNVTLNKKLGRSRNRLELTFTLPEDLDELAQIAPDMKRARDTDGNYHFLVTGTVLAPHVRPSRTGAKGATAGNAIREGGVRDSISAGGPGGDFDPSMDEGDRKERREKRIAERRERLRKRREEAERNAPADGPNNSGEIEPPNEGGQPEFNPEDMEKGGDGEMPPPNFEDGPPVDYPQGPEDGMIPGDFEPPQE